MSKRISKEVNKAYEFGKQEALSELEEKVRKEKELHEGSFDPFDDGLAQGMQYVLQLITEMKEE